MKINKMTMLSVLLLSGLVRSQEYYTCVPKKDWWANIVKQNVPTNNKIEGLFLCPQGYKISGTGEYRSCVPCSKGEYKNVISDSGCMKCPVGTYAPSEGRSYCSLCEAGKSSKVGSSSCYKCPKGGYSPKKGSSCLLCPTGTYSDEEGSTGCKPCSDGTYSISFVGLSAEEKDNFPKRSYCKSCNPGTYVNLEKNGCKNRCEFLQGELLSSNGKNCVRSCLDDEFMDEGVCVKNCPRGKTASGKMCV